MSTLPTWRPTSSLVRADAGGGGDPLSMRMWRRALAAYAWETVVEVGSHDVDVTTLDDVLGPEPGPFCVKVDVEGLEHEVVAGARRSLAADVPWVLMLEVKHLPMDILEGLATEHAVLLLAPGATPAGDRFVRAHPDHLEDLLPSGKVYGQDCLLAGPLAVGPLLGAQRG